MVDETRMKLILKKVSASLDVWENEILASSQSKKEYIQPLMYDKYNPHVRRSRIALKELIEEEVFRRLDPGNLTPKNDQEVIGLIEKSVEKILLGAENEIRIELKHTSLYENIKKNHNSEHGEFFNAYKDLTSIFATEYPQFTDFVKRAYGHARIELAAVLLLQGILSDSEFNDEQKLFPDIDVKQYIDLDSQPWGGLCRFALVLIFDRKITSNMVGTARRSQLEVFQVLDKLNDLTITEDDFSPQDYCGSKNIYECLLGSNENKQFSEGPQDDDEIPF